jgi:hypothetical protein
MELRKKVPRLARLRLSYCRCWRKRVPVGRLRLRRVRIMFFFCFARAPSSSRFPETASPETLGLSRLKNHLKQPQFVVEIPNLTTTISFPSLDLLRLSVWHMSIATSVPGKRWDRAVSVATSDPALGLSSRQDRLKTPVSSRYRAIGPIKDYWFH